MRAYRALQGYEAERIVALRLSPWLLTIAVNVAGKRLAVDGLDSVDEPMAAPLDEPERFSERRELSDHLADALLTLPPRYRAAVILRHVLGFGYDDIADTLEQPA